MHKPLFLVAILALALPGTTPALGVGVNQPGGVAHAGQQPHRVTLITGDVVTFFEDNQFSVEPAERPDGRRVTFRARTGETIATSARDFYVFPSDVVGDARLDRELFNVEGLVREGLDRVETLPVIVKSGEASPFRAAKPTGPGFWRNLAKDAKVWLDHRYKVSLDKSVPQIGAPQAWAAGHDGTGVTVAVIDTGIDAAHPDLAGRVVAAKNFTDDEDAGDYHGHGTHVASTIAGSGAAAAGKYKGVAPGAKLVNAKGCSGEGLCYVSWLMSAMDYAAHSGARVINLSVGGGVSDGSDPLSLEVNRLTAETGALFVIAAGNDGQYGNITVGSPGAAASALTVGAVDKSDKLAYFSSRGPRYGDAAIKPDVTAPGVSIVAARATGTSMGEPVNDHYTASNGTSMATPHVAGAAAILAGQHTDWQAGRIKDTLVSTSKHLGGRVIDEGAGRVDVARAFQSKLTGSSPVDFGRVKLRSVKLRKITYRNDSDRGTMLNLKLTGAGWNGRPLPVGAVSLSPKVFVPAHGTADAHLIVNTFVGNIGSYSGVVTATAGDGTSLRTPVSYYVIPPVNQLTVKVFDHTGKQSKQWVEIIRDNFDPERNNDPFYQLYFDGDYAADGTVTAQVPVGTYTAMTDIYERGLTKPIRWTSLSKVDAPVRRATTINLDARAAKPVKVDAGDAETLVHNISMARTVSGGFSTVSGCSCGNAEVLATPTPAPRKGSLSLQDTWTFAERTTAVSVGGRTLGSIHDPHLLAAKFPGESDQPVVWAGDGTDFSGIDVRGKVALVGLTIPANSEDPWWDAYLAAYAAAGKAQAAGAAAIAAYVDVDGALAMGLRSSRTIPYLGLSRTDGLALRAAGSLHVKTKPSPEYIYNVHYSAPNGVAEDNTHVVDRSKLTRVQSEYHADKPGFKLRRAFIGFRKGHAGTMVTPAVDMPARVTVDEYVGGSPDAIENVDWSRVASIDDGNRNQLTMWNRRPFTAKDVWFSGPSTPGGFDPNHRAFYRINIAGTPQQYFFSSWYMGDGTPGHILDTNYFGYSATRYRLFKDGAEVRPTPSGLLPVPDEPATYRLEAVTVLPTSGLGGPTLGTRILSPRTDTTWTWRSDRGRPAPCDEGSPFECKDEPLLQPFFDLGLDLANNAPSGRAHTFGVQIHRTTQAAPAELAGLNVSYSTDEGATWQAATVANGRATVNNPASGFVWLRVEAWTPAGERVVQTIQRVYGVA